MLFQKRRILSSHSLKEKHRLRSTASSQPPPSSAPAQRGLEPRKLTGLSLSYNQSAAFVLWAAAGLTLFSPGMGGTRGHTFTPSPRPGPSEGLLGHGTAKPPSGASAGAEFGEIQGSEMRYPRKEARTELSAGLVRPRAMTAPNLRVPRPCAEGAPTVRPSVPVCPRGHGAVSAARNPPAQGQPDPGRAPRRTSAARGCGPASLACGAGRCHGRGALPVTDCSIGKLLPPHPGRGRTARPRSGRGSLQVPAGTRRGPRGPFRGPGRGPRAAPAPPRARPPQLGSPRARRGSRSRRGTAGPARGPPGVGARPSAPRPPSAPPATHRLLPARRPRLPLLLLLPLPMPPQLGGCRCLRVAACRHARAPLA